MFEKLVMAIALTLSLHLFFGFSQRPAATTSSEINLKQTQIQTVSQLP